MPSISELTQYVASAFERRQDVPPVPHGLRGQQRSDVDRQRTAAIAHNRQIVSRRWVVGGVGLGTAAVLVGGPLVVIKGLEAYDNAQKDTSEIFEPLAFTGSVEEIRRNITQWDEEVKRNPNALEKRLPQIRDLAAVFFSRKMNEQYGRYKQYNADELRKKVTFTTDVTHKKIQQQHCDENDKIPALTLPLTAEIYINKDHYKRRMSVGMLFVDMIHEYHHASSNLEMYPGGVQVYGVPDTITAKKGLTAVAMDEQQNATGKQCIKGYYINFEEIVIQDSVFRMADEIGISTDGAPYRRDVEKYRGVVLAGNNQQQLLRYQQLSDGDGFFRTIGEKSSAQTDEERIVNGTKFMMAFFPGNAQ